MYQMNPITRLDYPEPDVIRVEDTYYMLCTTMHFYPGGVILRSYDLQHWENAGYLFQKSLTGAMPDKMQWEQTSYGKGMESGCLRYHNGTFYATFIARGGEKSYLFKSQNIEGPWECQEMTDIYFDGSLLFDDDGKVYMAHGYGKIWITELESDLSGTKKGGYERLILEDTGEHYLDYKGSHFYKINDRYYLFLMQWAKDGTARRKQLCFCADSLDLEFEGREVFDDDNGYHNQGIAQGGIVDTPSGKWYAMLSQDMGASGRMPILVPVTFENRFPVFGINKKLPCIIEVASSRPYYRYEPLVTDDDFNKVLKKQWQWNHQPNEKLWRILENGGLEIRTGKISTNLIHAQNTLTQRMFFPNSEAEVLVDGSKLKEGDFAGLCALQSCYGFIGITKEMNQYYLVLIVRELKDSSMQDLTPDYLPGTICEKVKLETSKIRLKLAADFTDMQDTVEFFSEIDGNWKKIGKKHKVYFKMDHFMGCRYGLTIYSTKEIGGGAVFKEFRYH